MQGRHSYYDGAFYARMVDPTVRGLHRLIAAAIPDDVSLIDACCGTGAFARSIAARVESVVGVDLSPGMVAYARRQRGRDNVDFAVADVADLSDFATASFDYATIIMGLHEMPTAIRNRVLPSLARVANRVVAVDFAPAMRWNRAGVRNRMMELLAGPRHFGGFRDYTRRGGLPPLIDAAEVSVLRHGLIDAGNIDIYTLTADRDDRATRDPA